MSSTPNLSLPYLTSGQASAEITVNDSLNLVDAFCRGALVSRDDTDPPASPDEGDGYLIGDDATGLWVGHDRELAFYFSGWIFVPPKSGFRFWVDDVNDTILYNGSSWIVL